jgi:hypothetical protein
MANLFKFKVETKGAQQKFRALGKGANDSETLHLIGDRILRFIDHQFTTKGGGAWAANKPNTVADKGHSQVLIGKTGRLRKSWQKRVAKRYSVTVYSTEPKKAEWAQDGTRPHQIGTAGKIMAFRSNSGKTYKGFAFRTGPFNHPGTPPRPILPERAYAKLLIETVAMIRNRMLIGTGGK